MLVVRLLLGTGQGPAAFGLSLSAKISLKVIVSVRSQGSTLLVLSRE